MIQICYRIFDYKAGLDNLLKSCNRFCRKVITLHKDQFRISQHNGKGIVDFVVKHDYRLLYGIGALGSNAVGPTKESFQSRNNRLYKYLLDALSTIHTLRVTFATLAHTVEKGSNPNGLGFCAVHCLQTRTVNFILAQMKVSNNLRGMAYQVYILRCCDGTFYTGQTTDLDKRIAAHNRGTGARYTRGRGPVELVYHTGVPTLREAFLLEHKIKRMKRADKEKLIGSLRTSTSAST